MSSAVSDARSTTDTRPQRERTRRRSGVVFRPTLECALELSAADIASWSQCPLRAWTRNRVGRRRTRGPTVGASSQRSAVLTSRVAAGSCRSRDESESWPVSLSHLRAVPLSLLLTMLSCSRCQMPSPRAATLHQTIGTVCSCCPSGVDCFSIRTSSLLIRVPSVLLTLCPPPPRLCAS